MGTKFNVKSYPEETRTEVSLVEGSIDLDFKYNGANHSYSLTPGTSLIFNHASGKVESYSFSSDDYISWSDENAGIYFRNITLEEIALELQRKFDVLIVIRDENLKKELYYASFVNNESLNEILEMLNINKTLKFIRKNNVIDIFPSK